MKRLHQCVLIGSFLPLCWLGMMAVHELGHIAAGWATGGTVTRVVLHPLAISRTDVAPNPRPLVVVWAGPLVGVIIPLLIWGAIISLRVPGDYLTRFFAGFCCIANGAYIGVGSFDGIGDAGEMLRHGSPIWVLWMFGVLTIPVGFLCWHRLGPHFGLGQSHGQVSARAAYVSLTMLTVVLMLAFSLSSQE